MTFVFLLLTGSFLLPRLSPCLSVPAVGRGTASPQLMVAPVSDDAVGQWLTVLQESLEQKRFVKLTLSSNTKSSNMSVAHLHQLRRVQGRLVSLKSGPRLQLTLKYEHRDAVHNVPLPTAGSALRDYVGATACRNGRLFCTDGDLELTISRRGVARLLKQKPTMTTAAPSTHDRVKTREVDAAAEYLVALGVTTADGVA